MSTAHDISKKRLGSLLVIGVIILFTAIGAIRSYPFNVDVDTYLQRNPGDDWYTYAYYGRDISQNGLLLNSVKGPYFGPSGFFYSYFVALFFKVFGDNVSLVFFFQHLLTGLAVALMYWTYAGKMGKYASMLLLTGLSLFTFLDVSRYYSVTLLSENLAFYIMALFFYCFIKGYEENHILLCLFSALLLGLSVLTRPNMILFPFFLIILIAGRYIHKWKKAGKWILLSFVAIFLLASSLLGLRNYLVCGKWVFMPEVIFKCKNTPVPHAFDVSLMKTDPVYLKLNKLGLDENFCIQVDFIRKEPFLFFKNYTKRALFCLGFTPLFDSKYRVRFHWIVMWLIYFAYLFVRLRGRKKFELWESSTHLFIFCHYGTLLVVSHLNAYGFRYLLPAPDFVLVFVFVALDKLLKRYSTIKPSVQYAV
jgi:4-amino-4-deoxy-L-arabinose transferase-like glycosyltransferase